MVTTNKLYSTKHESRMLLASDWLRHGHVMQSGTEKSEGKILDHFWEMIQSEIFPKRDKFSFSVLGGVPSIFWMEIREVGQPSWDHGGKWLLDQVKTLQMAKQRDGGNWGP